MDNSLETEFYSCLKFDDINEKMTQTNHHCSHQTSLSKAEPKNLCNKEEGEREREWIIMIEHSGSYKHHYFILFYMKSSLASLGPSSKFENVSFSQFLIK